jgi:hypothetical protein
MPAHCDTCSFTPYKTSQAMYYNVTLRRLRAAIVAVEKQWVLHNLSVVCVCVCSPRHPARNAHAPYCHLWPGPLYNIFPQFLINGTIFGKKSYWTQKVRFDFLYNFCLEHFSFYEEWARYDQKCISVFMWSALYSCPILMKLEFSLKVFGK